MVKLKATNEALQEGNRAQFQDFRLNAMLTLKSGNEKLEILEAQNKSQSEKLRNQNIIKSISALLALLIVFTIYFYRKKQKAHRLLEQKQLELATVNSELNHKNQLILDQNELLTEQKEELISELKTKLTMLADNHKVINQVKEIISKNNEITTSNKRTILRGIENKENKRIIENIDFHFIELHKEFYAKMSQLHPDLTSNNLKMCVYLKMNLETKEIASLMHVTPGAILVARSRLRKKLGITDPNRSLSTYLNSILENNLN